MKHHVYQGYSFVQPVDEYDPSELGWINYDVKPKKKLLTARTLFDDPIPEYLYSRDNLDWDNDYVLRPKPKLPTARVLIDPVPIPEYLYPRDELDWDNDYVVKPIVFKLKPRFNDEILSPQWYLEPRSELDWDNDYIIQPILPRWGYRVIFDHFYAVPTLVYPKCVSSYMTEFPPPYGGRI